MTYDDFRKPSLADEDLKWVVDAWKRAEWPRIQPASFDVWDWRAGGLSLHAWGFAALRPHKTARHAAGEESD